MRIQFNTFFFVLCLFFSGCVTTSEPIEIKPAAAEQSVAVRAAMQERDIVVPLQGGAKAKLRSVWFAPQNHARDVTVIMVPGSGQVSRYGNYEGDGVTSYEAPVAVTLLWASALVERGFDVVAYDKRTCSPLHDPDCRANPSVDIDTEGPRSYAKDLDAACRMVKSERGDAEKIVVWAPAQAAQVALVSECAQSVDLLVLVAPIPGRIDQIWVDGLREAARLRSSNFLRQKAESLQATFDSIQKGLFSNDAKVMGATLKFWRKWMELTASTKKLLGQVNTPMLVLLGAEDRVYSKSARAAVLEMGDGAKRSSLTLPGANHHLLTRQTVDAKTADLVAKALQERL